MNEKIKELAKEAGFNQMGIWNIIGIDEYNERFAELIVRKCIESTLSLHDIAIDHQWNLDETFHVIVDTIVQDLDMQHIFRS